MEVINPALLHGEMEELEVEVEGVRCCLLFTILLTLGLGLHPLNKLLPGYFILHIFHSWILISQDMREASNTKGFVVRSKFGKKTFLITFISVIGSREDIL